MNELPAQNMVNAVLHRVVALPRWVRIALALIFAVSLTLLVTPVVDSIYMARFYSEGTLVLPSLISTAVGVVLYFVGWRLMVGFAGETPKPTMSLLVYFVVGTLICLTALVLVVSGALSGTAV
jgi:hypothetical protein